jgi:hypothetical protein
MENKDNNTDGDLREQSIEQPSEESTDEGEFKVTVRKLELPVQPRGVLADG